MNELSENTGKLQARTFAGLSFPWLVTLAGAVLLMLSNVGVNTFGVFFKPVAEEFQWSRSEVSLAIFIRFAVMAIVTIPLGYWTDRYGPRRVMLPCLALCGVAFVLFGRVTILWQLYLVQGLFMGIALAGPFVCVMSTVAKWHVTRQGMALGIAAGGTGLSSVIFPPLTTKLIQGMGWQNAAAVLGLTVLLVTIPISFLLRDPRARTGEPPAKDCAAPRDPLAAWRALSELSRNRTLLKIVLMLFFFYFSSLLVIQHLVNYVTDAGLTAMVAASMMSVMGVASVAGRLAMGTISDRVDTRVDALTCCALVTAGLLLLSLKVPALMWVAVTTFGVGFGGAAPLISRIVTKYFGRERLATLSGIVLIGSNMGSAAGPWAGGLIFDISQSYLWALLLSAAFTVTALLLALKLPSVSPGHRSTQST